MFVETVATSVVPILVVSIDGNLCLPIQMCARSFFGPADVPLTQLKELMFRSKQIDDAFVWIEDAFSRAIPEGNEEGIVAAAVTAHSMYLGIEEPEAPNFEIICGPSVLGFAPDGATCMILCMRWIGDPH